MDKSHTHLFVYLQSQYPEVDVTSDFCGLFQTGGLPQE